MKDLSQLKSQLLADPEVRAEYDALGPEFIIARELIGARARAGLTQDEIASRMGTTQSTIARLESGRVIPSMRSIERYAKATGSRVTIRLES